MTLEKYLIIIEYETETLSITITCSVLQIQMRALNRAIS